MHWIPRPVSHWIIVVAGNKTLIPYSCPSKFPMKYCKPRGCWSCVYQLSHEIPWIKLFSLSNLIESQVNTIEIPLDPMKSTEMPWNNHRIVRVFSVFFPAECPCSPCRSPRAQPLTVEEGTTHDRFGKIHGVAGLRWRSSNRAVAVADVLWNLPTNSWFNNG